ncbi:hypothetical protein H0H92_015711 [Tricholoma furcatifolium]|nr:hypothetical protein H0H92_015711 [Tricholoma furcatifolium]
MSNVDEDIKSILSIYSSLSFKPPAGQYTIAASFYLSSTSTPTKVISFATGTKCLPTSRYPLKGEALLDSHAEILARRGAIRWFLLEVLHCESPGQYESLWIQRRTDGRYELKKDVRIGGDASMRFLASGQDEEMAALKDSSIFAALGENEASRGRDNYSRLGVLRTKPGRADSPPTMCMSCSDKIASWTVLGFQGTLATRFVTPLYLSLIVIGEVPPDLQDFVKEDCQRALWKRLGSTQGESLFVSSATHTAVLTDPKMDSQNMVFIRLQLDLHINHSFTHALR